MIFFIVMGIGVAHKLHVRFTWKISKKETRINVAYWILKDSKCIPEDMAFIQDLDNEEHYLLAITKDMKLTALVQKLTWISQRMSVLNGLQLEAYK
jgi:hypothetical protein